MCSSRPWYCLYKRQNSLKAKLTPHCVVGQVSICCDKFKFPFSLASFVKTFVLFLPCACVSGMLYLRVLRALRRGKTNAMKARLSQALSVLWLSWVLANIPFLSFEIAMHTKLNNVYPWEENLYLHWTARSVDIYVQQSFNVSCHRNLSEIPQE